MNADQAVQDALRNLLLMLNTVVTSGFSELRPQPLTSVLYVLPGFSLPQPSGQGNETFFKEKWKILNVCNGKTHFQVVVFETVKHFKCLSLSFYAANSRRFVQQFWTSYRVFIVQMQLTISFLNLGARWVSSGK